MLTYEEKQFIKDMLCDYRDYMIQDMIIGAYTDLQEMIDLNRTYSMVQSILEKMR